jgi:hypothetical protein
MNKQLGGIDVLKKHSRPQECKAAAPTDMSLIDEGLAVTDSPCCARALLTTCVYDFFGQRPGRFQQVVPDVLHWHRAWRAQVASAA